MKTVTVSVRLPEDDADRLQRAASGMGLDRSTFLRRALERGAQALMLERACDAYRRREVSLSRAAEMAGLSQRDIMLKLHDQGVELNYGQDDLAKDLQPL